MILTHVVASQCVRNSFKWDRINKIKKMDGEGIWGITCMTGKRINIASTIVR